VAEGVETKQEFEMLRGLGCDVAQGYYIAHPMAAPDFIRWADDHRSGNGELLADRPYRPS
jgi:EAL domain-containing protein (putative c-di-GMP-specific phosphodiesterase class I)